MASITVKQKEAKTITFTITSDGSAVDVSSAVLSFQVKENKDDAAVISKTDEDFDKTSASSGIVTLNLSDTDLDLEAITYTAELKTVFEASVNIDKSVDIEFIVQDAVID